jgi:hypothetical protein
MSAEPRCSNAQCGHAARWGLVLLLVPSRTYAGKAWRFRTSVAVCTAHKVANAEHFLSEALWKQILDFFDASKRPRPHRLSTRVDFVSLLDDDEAN